MNLNEKAKRFMELYEALFNGYIQKDELDLLAALNDELELIVSLKNELKQNYKNKEDRNKMKFLISLKLSERKLSLSDIDGCRKGLQDCHKLLVKRKDLLNNSIQHLYANESSEKSWRSDSCKLDLLALEVLILDDNFDTAHILMSKCEAYGMTKMEESHLAKLAYLAGSKLYKIKQIEFSTIWLKSSFSIGRKIINNEVTNAAGNLLLKIMAENKDWRGARALIDILPYSFNNQLYLLSYQIDKGNHIQVINMIKNLLKKSPLTCEQAYKLLGVVSGRDDLMEVMNENSIGDNWSKREQEEWLASLVCLSLNLSTIYMALSNYNQWASKNIDQSIHRCFVLKFADKKLEELYKSLAYDILEKWFNALIILAQIGKDEELFCHFAECMVALLLKQSKFNTAIELLEKWQFVFPKNSKLIQLMLWVILHEGKVDAFPILIKALQEKCLKVSDDFWHIFTGIISNCMESQKLSNQNIQMLFSLLADCGYFGSLDLLRCGVLIFCQMKDAETLVCLLTVPSARYLISQYQDSFCSSVCWNTGLQTTNHTLRYKLLRLANQFLPPKDPSFFSTCLVSISAGLSCLSSRCIDGPQVYKQLTTDIVQLLETRCQSTTRRAALLYNFRLLLLTEGRLEMFRSILRKLEELKDAVALETLSLMAANQNNYNMDVIAVDAILKALALNGHIGQFKEGVLLSGLEIISRGKAQGSQLSSIIENLSVIWEETKNKKLIARAIRLVWNTWVKNIHQGESFGVAVVVLYNLISNDKILSVLEKPTLALSNRIRKILI